MKKKVFSVLLALFSLAVLLTACTGISASNLMGSNAVSSDGKRAQGSETTAPTSSASGQNNGGGGAQNSDGTVSGGENGDTIMIQIEMENGGIIKLELYPDKAPITVDNFVSLVKDGFYDGLIFHRIISGFMIQGGDPEGTGMGGSGKNIKGEFRANGVENDIAHERGVISMARSQEYDSASSQFFIMHGSAPWLDGQYAAFGRVTEGMDVVDEIAAVTTDKSDRPLEDVVIKSITVIE